MGDLQTACRCLWCELPLCIRQPAALWSACSPSQLSAVAHHAQAFACLRPQFSFHAVAEGAWILRCRCKHKHTEHDPITYACRKPNCKCGVFDSPWVCNCNHSWSSHMQVRNSLGWDESYIGLWKVMHQVRVSLCSSTSGWDTVARAQVYLHTGLIQHYRGKCCTKKHGASTPVNAE